MLLQLCRYSAVTTKARAMYGKRLKSADYNALINMGSISDITAYLKRHPGYASVLEDTDVHNVATTYLETALSRVLHDEFGRLFLFVMGKSRELFNLLVIMHESDELLHFIRRMLAGKQASYRPILSEPVKKHSRLPYEKLSACNNLSDLCKMLDGTVYQTILSPFMSKAELPYTLVEIALRSHFFHQAFDALDDYRDKPTSKALRELLGSQVDMLNFTHVIRCKRYFDQPNDHIYPYLIPLTHKLDRKLLNAMVRAESWEKAYDLIYKSRYQRFFEAYRFDNVEKYYYEILLMISAKIIHSGLPSVCVAFAALYHRQIEIRNVIHIIEGVRYQMSPSDIARHLSGMA